jgi:hypothetical protein
VDRIASPASTWHDRRLALVRFATLGLDWYFTLFEEVVEAEGRLIGTAVVIIPY